MAEILGVTNPVPGFDGNTTNRNISALPSSNEQIQNIADPSRVVRPDGRTEHQQGGDGAIRYDSNFQSFIQRLRESPNLAQELAKLFATREGTVVSSGMSAGIAQELSRALELLRMEDPQQLLDFLTAQVKDGNRFNGALFSLLRGAYTRAASDGVRSDILQFLKSYSDHSSTAHIEGNLLRNLQGMADAMPASWGAKLREVIAQLQNGIAAGDRQGNIQLLQKEVFPHMAEYVEQTHDIGAARGLLTLLALDVARYENGAEDKLLQLFHQLNAHGTLKSQLGGIDDRSLLALLQGSQPAEDSPTVKFADHLTAAAARALRGEGGTEVQEIFKNLVSAMLVNESVYMPINHYLIPLEWEGKMLFSELWVDPEAEDEAGKGQGGQGKALRFLFKIDVESLGLFDVVLTSRDKDVDIRIACPEKVSTFSKEIEQSVAEILRRNELNPTGVLVRRMDRPVTLTEVFPKIFEGRNSVNVKA